jgi:hypothetical protein
VLSYKSEKWLAEGDQVSMVAIVLVDAVRSIEDAVSPPLLGD